MKLITKIKRIFRNKKYEVYCPYCNSCGDTGCCFPTICINHPKGRYCERNMGDLRVAYYTLDKFWQWVYNNKESNKEVIDKLNNIYDRENYKLEEYFKTLPKKLTFVEKIKKWITKKWIRKNTKIDI